MENTLLVVCTLFGTLQVGQFQNSTPIISGIPLSPDEIVAFDTSNYKILSDRRGGNFTVYEAKCRGELSFKIEGFNPKLFKF